jgi:hypothetical protein
MRKVKANCQAAGAREVEEALMDALKQRYKQ